MNKFKIGDEVESFDYWQKGLIFKITKILGSWYFGGLNEDGVREDFLTLVSNK